MDLAASYGSLVPVPYISAIARLLLEALTPRTIEEDILLFRTRSQYIGPLSAVSAFLGAVQAQFVSFTYQKNDTALQKAANLSFILGVSLNIMGALRGLVAANALPNLTSLQEDLGAYKRAIEEAEMIFGERDISDAYELLSTVMWYSSEH